MVLMTALSKSSFGRIVCPNTKESEPVSKTFFYQIKCHRRGIKRKQIQQAFTKYMSPHLSQKLTVAFNRPRTIKDELCRNKLPKMKGNNSSDMLQKIRKETQLESGDSNRRTHKK